MNIGIGIVAEPNCRKELEITLKSVESFYPVFVVVSKWNDIKLDAECIDGTLGLIDSYSNTICFELKNTLEPNARNQYLIYGGKFGCDAIIIVDSDEYLDLPLGKSFFERQLERKMREYPDINCFSVLHNAKRFGGISKVPRVIKNPSFCRYRDVHNKIYYNNKNILRDTQFCPGLIIQESKEFRSNIREKKMLNRNKNNPKH